MRDSVTQLKTFRKTIQSNMKTTSYYKMRTTKYKKKTKKTNKVNNSRKHGKQEDMSGPPHLRLSCHVLKCSPPKIQPGIDGYAPALYREN